MTDQPTRSHVEFSNAYERRNLRALRGSVEERAHLFSHWDEVLPQRPQVATVVLVSELDMGRNGLVGHRVKPPREPGPGSAA